MVMKMDLIMTMIRATELGKKIYLVPYYSSCSPKLEGKQDLSVAATHAFWKSSNCQAILVRQDIYICGWPLNVERLSLDSDGWWASQLIKSMTYGVSGFWTALCCVLITFTLFLRNTVPIFALLFASWIKNILEDTYLKTWCGILHKVNKFSFQPSKFSSAHSVAEIISCIFSDKIFRKMQVRYASYHDPDKTYFPSPALPKEKAA